MRLNGLLFLIFIFYSLKEINGDEHKCGLANENKLKFKVINGVLSLPHQYPWAVYLKSGKQHFCGGTLINERYVLTAAHCVHRRRIYACMGHRYIYDNTIRCYNNEKTIVHPDYTPFENFDTNDIALLRLDRNVEFSPTISPICLPSDPNNNYTGVMGILYGYGTQAYKKNQLFPMSEYLYHTALKVIDNNICATNKYISYGFNTTTMMCAYMPKTDGCVGDSGSGFMVLTPKGNYELIGIMSWGTGCAKLNSPGVYTRISTFLPWIKQVIGHGNV